jgi:hypothetical protein
MIVIWSGRPAGICFLIVKFIKNDAPQRSKNQHIKTGFGLKTVFSFFLLKNRLFWTFLSTYRGYFVDLSSPPSYFMKGSRRSLLVL